MDAFSSNDDLLKKRINQPNNSLGEPVQGVIDNNQQQPQYYIAPWATQNAQQEQEDTGYIDAALRGMKAQAAGALGGQADFVTGVLGTDGAVGDALQGVMQRNNRKRNYEWKDIISRPIDYALDPEGLAYDVGGGFGSSGVLGMEGLALATALPAGVTAGVGSGIAAAAARMGIPWLGKVMSTPAGKALIGNVLKTPLEGMSEGGNVYREMTHDEYGNPIQDADKDVARKAMYTDAALNSALLTFTNSLESMGLGSLIAGAGGKNVFTRIMKGAVGDFLQNGYEEGAQQGINLYSQNKGTLGQIVNPLKWIDEQYTEALIGGITGLGQGAIMTGGGTLANKVLGNQQPNETEQPTIQYPEEPIENVQGEQDKQKQGTMRPIPVAEGIEDEGLANTNPTLRQGVDALNTWVYENFGKDMLVSGGARSEENNAAVNGSPTSHHLTGNAIDIDLSAFSEEERQAIMERALAMGFNSDGEDMYHDKGTGLHLHLIMPSSGGFNIGGMEYTPHVNNRTTEAYSAPTNDYVDEYLNNLIQGDNAAGDAMASMNPEAQMFNEALESSRRAQETAELTQEEYIARIESLNTDLERVESQLAELTTKKAGPKAINAAKNNVEQLKKQLDRYIHLYQKRYGEAPANFRRQERTNERNVEAPKQNDGYIKSRTDNELEAIYRNMSDLADTNASKRAVLAEMQKRGIVAGDNFVAGSNIVPYGSNKREVATVGAEGKQQQPGGAVSTQTQWSELEHRLAEHFKGNPESLKVAIANKIRQLGEDANNGVISQEQYDQAVRTLNNAYDTILPYVQNDDVIINQGKYYYGDPKPKDMAVINDAIEPVINKPLANVENRPASIVESGDVTNNTDGGLDNQNNSVGAARVSPTQRLEGKQALPERVEEYAGSNVATNMVERRRKAVAEKRNRIGNNESPDDIITTHRGSKTRSGQYRGGNSIQDAVIVAEEKARAAGVPASAIAATKKNPEKVLQLAGNKNINPATLQLAQAVNSARLLSPRNKVKAELQEKVQGKPIHNKATNTDAILSSTGIKKMLSDKAVNKSIANGFTEEEHLEAAEQIKSLFEEAELAEERPDTKNNDSNVTIKRYTSGTEVGKENKKAVAKITVKETVENGQRIYSVELEEITKPTDMENSSLNSSVGTENVPQNTLRTGSPSADTSVTDNITQSTDNIKRENNENNEGEQDNVQNTKLESNKQKEGQASEGEAERELNNIVEQKLKTIRENDIPQYKKELGNAKKTSTYGNNSRAAEYETDTRRYTLYAVPNGDNKFKVEVSDKTKDFYTDGVLIMRDATPIETEYFKTLEEAEKYIAEDSSKVVESKVDTTTKGDNEDVTDSKRLSTVPEGNRGSGENAVEETGNNSRPESGHVSPKVQRTGGSTTRGESNTTESGVSGSVEAPSNVGKPSKGDSNSGDVREGLTPAQKEGAPASEHAGHNYTITPSSEKKKAGFEPKKKYKANVDALKLLNKLEKEGRMATPEEQKKLAQYVGWGGLANAFSPYATDWKAEYQELQNLVDKGVITKEEYNRMKASTRTAFYTPVGVVQSVWDILDRMGFKGGRVLEPSMGVGNFFGLMPEAMRSNSTLSGVEWDTVTGKIAKQLYQKANIQINGFEKTSFPDNHFDLVISNVPFDDSNKPVDKKYNKNNYAIHNYFFNKALGLTRSGGFVCFITSTETMNGGGQSAELRKALSKNADFIGAIRLPDNTFSQDANTKTAADLIILQKREGQEAGEHNHEWVETVDTGLNSYKKIPTNSYFKKNKKMQIGTDAQGGMHGSYNNSGVIGKAEDGRSNIYIDVDKEIKKRVKYFPENIYQERKQEYNAAESTQEYLKPTTIHAGSFIAGKDGKVVQKDAEGQEVALPEKVQKRASDYLPLRDKVKELLSVQLDKDTTDKQIKDLQKELNTLYDKFVAKYGALNANSNKVLSADPDFGMICSIENYRPEKTEGKGKNKVIKEQELVEKRAIFTERTINAYVVPDKVANSADALSLSLSQKDGVDVKYMAELTGKTESEIVKELEGKIYFDPNKDMYVPADEYLSGNVREKLEQAEIAQKYDKKYQGNIEALQKAVPKDLKTGDIRVELGSNWIPASDYKDFVAKMLNTSPSNINMAYNPISGWSVDDSIRGEWNNANNNSTWASANKDKFGKSINHYTFLELLPYIMNKAKLPQIYNGSGDNKVASPSGQLALQGLVERIQKEFTDWIWKNPERETRLLDYYNRTYNSIVPRKYDGSHLDFKAWKSILSPDFRDNQKDGIWRIMQGNTLLAHCVGAGKTWTMQAAAMEMKRLGIANKSMFVIPPHMLKQFENEFRQIAPTAKLLVIDSESLPDVPSKKDKKYAEKLAVRNALLSRIATENWDGIIIAHNLFTRIPMTNEAYRNFIQEQLDELETALRIAAENNDESISVKKLEGKKKSLETKLEKLLSTDNKDLGLPFEQLGVDQLFVDEADLYKNLEFSTVMGNIQGLSNSASQRSQDMYVKTRWLSAMRNGKGVCFATGTPISNSLAEEFTMLRYLAYDKLKEMGLHNFDAWASVFTKTKEVPELNPSGNGFRMVKRLEFTNGGDLMRMFRSVADVIKQEDLLKYGVKLPKLKNNQRTVVQVEEVPIYRDFLENEIWKRVEKIHGGSVDPTEDNMLKITSEQRLASLDMRLIRPSTSADKAGAKVKALAERAYKKYLETEDIKGTQVVFCDLSTPKGVSNSENENVDTDTEETFNFNVYNDIKKQLIKQGIKPEEIAFIHDAGTDKDKKQELFDKVNSGEIRIIIGSTSKMGAGTNFQKRLVALHHLDAPWRPRDVEQREGRLIRQGNMNDEVEIFTYVTKGSFDENMWDKIKKKSKTIGDAMSDDFSIREFDDIGGAETLSYAAVQAVASRNPLLAEKTQVDAEVAKYESMQAAYQQTKRENEREIDVIIPDKISYAEQMVKNINKDIEERYDVSGDNFKAKLLGKEYSNKENASEKLEELKQGFNNEDWLKVGEYGGFDIMLKGYKDHINARLQKNAGYGVDTVTFNGFDFTMANKPERLLKMYEEDIVEQTKRLAVLKEDVKKPFAEQAKLDELLKKQADINAAIERDTTSNQNNNSNQMDNGKYTVDPETGELIETKASIATKQQVQRAYEKVYSEIQSAFPNAKFERRDNGQIVAELPNGAKFAISIKDNIILNARQQKRADASHGTVGGIIQGFWKKFTANGVDRLLAVSRHSQQGTAYHEALHAAMDLALTEKERNSLLNYYAQEAKKQGRDTEETLADAYRDWKLARQNHKGTLFGKLWQKIKDLCTRLKSFFDEGAKVESIFLDIESGKIYERNNKYDNGKKSTSSINVDTDSAYVDALNSGDMKKAKKIVEDAAQKAGYTYLAYHGTNNDFTVFNKDQTSKTTQRFLDGFYFTDNVEIAKLWADMRTKQHGGNARVIKAFLKTEKPLVLTDKEYLSMSFDKKHKQSILDKLNTGGYDSVVILPFKNGDSELGAKARKYLLEHGLSEQTILNFSANGIKGLTEQEKWDMQRLVMNPDFTAKQVAVFNADQIKSADTVTYDDNGKIIPLAERFSQASDDIRYSVARPKTVGKAFSNSEISKSTYNAIKDEGVTGYIKDKMKNFYRDWFDKNDPLHSLDNALATGLGVKELDSDKSIYNRAQTLSSNVAGEAEALVQGSAQHIAAINEKLKLTGNKALKAVTIKDVLSNVDAKTMDKAAPTYLADNDFKNWVDALGAYLGARRLLEMGKLARQAGEKYTYPNNLTEAQLRDFVKNAPPQFAKAAAQYYVVNDNILKLMENAGLISPELHKVLNTKYKEYCPLMRDFSDTAAADHFIDGITNGGRGIANVSSMLKKISIEGSDRTVFNPLESTVKAIAVAANRCERNRVGQMAVDMVKQANGALDGVIKEIPTPKGGNASPDAKNMIFTVMQNGKKVAYQLDKQYEELYDPIVGYNTPAAGVIFGVAKVLAQTLRSGATMSPSFIVRNLIRDTIFAGVSSKNGFVPIVDSLRGAYALWKNPKARAEFEAAGVTAFNFYNHKESTYKDLLAMTGEKKIDWTSPKDIWDALVKYPELASEFVESATRMGEFLKAREKGMSLEEAARSARELTLDFSRSGVMGERYNQYVPFFNACLQGGDKMYRLFKENPMDTGLKLAKYIVLPSLILWCFNHDEDWYKELDPWVKNTCWCLPGGIRIPKPQEAGITFGSGIEAMLDQAFNKDPKAMANWTKEVVGAAKPNLIPTVFLPLIEWQANYSFFRNGTLVPKRLQGLPDEMQYTNHTATLSKGVGKLTGLSPVKIDNTVRGYTGTMGMFLWQMGDALEDRNEPAKKLSERQFFRDFNINDQHTMRFVNDFYELREAVNKEHAGYGVKGKPNADVVEIRKFGTIISGLNKDIQKITDSKTLSPAKKRELIDSKKNRIKAVAKKAVEKYGNKYL